MMPSTLHFRVSFIGFSLLIGCSTSDAAAPSAGGTSGGEDPGPPAYLCDDPGPLAGGDAVWGKAPIIPPSAGDPSDPDSADDGGADSGIGFIEMPDGGGASFECDLFAQDCPEGDKCMPWANDGGDQWNATRCSPVEDDAGVIGDECTADGSGVSGLDDCELGAMCWEVDDMNMGTCVEMCVGSSGDPLCPPGTWCYLGSDGSLAVCLEDELCDADGACHCMCPEGVDPDCTEDQCAPRAEVEVDALASLPPVVDQDEPSCPSEQEPVVMYMSNDDSNSQASPILARRYISEGLTVPKSAIRIHEFLNYYDFNAEPQNDAPALVSMEMRRTNAEAGEFTLMLSAQGHEMTADTRPPMNLVFSLDTSGSMEGAPIELLKDSMVSTAGQLRAGDVVSIVTWSTDQDVVLAGYVVAGPDDPELLGIIGSIVSGGGTDLHSGLVKAYQLANTHEIEHGINRVVLISDGGANAGVTEADLIASEAADEDGEGIYLVGVGVGTAHTYHDGLMDTVTDAGKGAYVYIDTTDEAELQFNRRFLANMAVSARNVRMRLTLPWYFGIEKFHGEEYSPVESEVEPQHLAPNDSMTFHQIVAACDPSLITKCDAVEARVDFVDPVTGAEMHDALEISIESLVARPAERLRKADVVVGYAKSLIVIAGLVQSGELQAASEVASNMHDWASNAAKTLDDDELLEIAELMKTYAAALAF